MIILILSEPRSGSTNLSLWLKSMSSEFIVIHEPYNPGSPDYQGSSYYNIDWIDIKKNYIINEKFLNNRTAEINGLINICDKVVCLYRENTKEQIESFVMASTTGAWTSIYEANRKILDQIDTIHHYKQEYFETLKQNFKELREFHNFKSFTYEDLYFRNKIDEFKEYLGLKIDIPFPIGGKYRRDIKVDKLI